jgi:hypothetical protein
VIYEQRDVQTYFWTIIAALGTRKKPKNRVFFNETEDLKELDPDWYDAERDISAGIPRK